MKHRAISYALVAGCGIMFSALLSGNQGKVNSQPPPTKFLHVGYELKSIEPPAKTKRKSKRKRVW